jgi:hypothetical protein
MLEKKEKTLFSLLRLEKKDKCVKLVLKGNKSYFLSQPSFHGKKILLEKISFHKKCSVHEKIYL